MNKHFLSSIFLISVFFAGAQTVHAAPATDCTIFVSPNGNGNGRTLASPTTLPNTVDNLIVPGSVVCLLPGTYRVNAAPFEINRSGTPAAWITFKSYNERAVIAPNVGPYDLFQIHRGSYIQIQNIEFDGRDSTGTIVASNAIACKGPAHHVKAVNNYIHDLGSGGIVSYTDHVTNSNGTKSDYFCDYMTVDRNIFYHNGYRTGWSSAISLNNDRIPRAWFDNNPGFHSIITNNIISGTIDQGGNPYSTPPGQVTDGNGIILDLGGNQQATPPVLIANNVVYQNGGRCIHTLNSGNAWIVNNTCYKNGLDLRSSVGNNSNFGEYIYCGSSNNIVVNNIAYGWNGRRLYSDEGCGVNGFALGTYRSNLYYTSATFSTVGFPTLNDPTKLRQADPLFQNPPTVDPSADGQYNAPLKPSQLTNQFYLQTGSLARRFGVDPITLTTDPAIQSGLRQYVFADIEGKARSSTAWDAGAYQTTTTIATTPLPPFMLYRDSLAPGWQNWSGTVVNLDNTTPAFSSPTSVAYTAPAWGTLDFANPSGFITNGYTHLIFMAQGSVENQSFAIYLRDMQGNTLKTPVPINQYGRALTTSWSIYSIPLEDLNGTNTTIGHVVFHEWSGNAQPVVYFDDIQFSALGNPIPTSTPGPTATPQPKVPGDATGDYHVRLDDYNMLVHDWGFTGTNLRSDFNNDKVVGLADYNILVHHFGE